MLSFIADLMIVVFCSIVFLAMICTSGYSFKNADNEYDKSIEDKLDKLLAHYENEEKKVEKENDGQQ